MNLEKLFEMQKALDERIDYKNKDRVSKKVLALLVELGELANETRCFKFWSNKPASEKEVVLEEFVDGVHFFISLAIEQECSLTDIIIYKRDNLVKQFHELFHQVSEVEKWSHKKVYTAFGYYIGLGEMLGFTWGEIEQAYMEKNKVNHERQDQGY